MPITSSARALYCSFPLCRYSRTRPLVLLALRAIVESYLRSAYPHNFLLEGLVAEFTRKYAPRANLSDAVRHIGTSHKLQQQRAAAQGGGDRSRQSHGGGESPRAGSPAPGNNNRAGGTASPTAASARSASPSLRRVPSARDALPAGASTMSAEASVGSMASLASTPSVSVYPGSATSSIVMSASVLGETRSGARSPRSTSRSGASPRAPAAAERGGTSPAAGPCRERRNKPRTGSTASTTLLDDASIYTRAFFHVTSNKTVSTLLDSGASHILLDSLVAALLDPSRFGSHVATLETTYKAQHTLRKARSELHRYAVVQRLKVTAKEHHDKYKAVLRTSRSAGVLPGADTGAAGGAGGARDRTRRGRRASGGASDTDGYGSSGTDGAGSGSDGETGGDPHAAELRRMRRLHEALSNLGDVFWPAHPPQAEPEESLRIRVPGGDTAGPSGAPRLGHTLGAAAARTNLPDGPSASAVVGFSPLRAVPVVPNHAAHKVSFNMTSTSLKFAFPNPAHPTTRRMIATHRSGEHAKRPVGAAAGLALHGSTDALDAHDAAARPPTAGKVDGRATAAAPRRAITAVEALAGELGTSSESLLSPGPVALEANGGAFAAAPVRHKSSASAAVGAALLQKMAYRRTHVDKHRFPKDYDPDAPIPIPLRSLLAQPDAGGPLASSRSQLGGRASGQGRSGSAGRRSPRAGGMENGPPMLDADGSIVVPTLVDEEAEKALATELRAEKHRRQVDAFLSKLHLMSLAVPSVLRPDLVPPAKPPARTVADRLRAAGLSESVIDEKDFFASAAAARSPPTRSRPTTGRKSSGPHTPLTTGSVSPTFASSSRPSTAGDKPLSLSGLPAAGMRLAQTTTDRLPRTVMVPMPLDPLPGTHTHAALPSTPASKGLLIPVPAATLPLRSSSAQLLEPAGGVTLPPSLGLGSMDTWRVPGIGDERRLQLDHAILAEELVDAETPKTARLTAILRSSTANLVAPPMPFGSGSRPGTPGRASGGSSRPGSSRSSRSPTLSRPGSRGRASAAPVTVVTSEPATPAAPPAGAPAAAPRGSNSSGRKQRAEVARKPTAHELMMLRDLSREALGLAPRPEWLSSLH